MRIFMEGQEEWLEPCGEVMVVIAKLMMGGAFVSLLGGSHSVDGASGFNRSCGAFQASHFVNRAVVPIRRVLVGGQILYFRRKKNARARDETPIALWRSFTRIGRNVAPTLDRCCEIRFLLVIRGRENRQVRN